jgi:hypothetical protein
MSQALMEKLNQKRNLEALWASEFLGNGAVTVLMLNISREIKKIEQEIKDGSEDNLV